MKFTQRAKEWVAVEENYKKLLATKQAIIWILTAILIVPDIILGYYYKINPMLIQHIGCFIRPINFITSQIMPNNILSENNVEAREACAPKIPLTRSGAPTLLEICVPGIV